MTVGLVSGPRPLAVNGDRDPAALTGDRTDQVTSTGGAGTPGVRRRRLARDDDRDRHRGTDARGGPLPGWPARADREILRVSQDRAGFTVSMPGSGARRNP